MGSFSVTIVGASWIDALPEEVSIIPQETAAELLGEIREWYRGIPEEGRFYLGEVTVIPSVSLRPEWIHVTVKTVAGRDGTNLNQVPRGEDSFIYDLETKTVGAGPVKKLSLKEALSRSFRIILKKELHHLERWIGMLQKQVGALE